MQVYRNRPCARLRILPLLPCRILDAIAMESPANCHLEQYSGFPPCKYWFLVQTFIYLPPPPTPKTDLLKLPYFRLLAMTEARS